MPQYMLLIYIPVEGGPSPDELAEQTPRWNEYTEALREAGVMREGDALDPAHTARTVRVREGETLVSDGPFAETREVLGGYYVVDVPDIETAEQWAARMPSAPYGSVEIRSVMVFPSEPEDAAARAGAQS